MRVKMVILLLLLCALPFIADTGLAVPMPAPTFMYSTSVNTQTYTGSVRPLQNSVDFSGVYFDADLHEQVTLPGAGSFLTNSPMALSGGFSGSTVYNRAEMYSDPVNWSAKILNYASSVWTPEEYRSWVNTSAGAGRWFVLTGAQYPISLRVDVVFQRTLYGHADYVLSGARAAASFTHIVTGILSPAATLRQRVLVFNGAILPPGEPCAFSLEGTVPDHCFDYDGAEHSINYVIRSNPFVVYPEVPFFLGLSLNANAAGHSAPFEGASFEAYSDFFDPGLATSSVFPGIAELTAEGFIVDVDGEPSTIDVVPLGQAGFQIQGFSGTLRGDMNTDLIVDISDVILELRMALALGPVQPCSDINGDQSVDISDVILTLRMALGLDLLRQCTA